MGTLETLKAGDRIWLLPPHPWAGNAGEIVAYEKYGLGWMGWRIKLDGNCGECFASRTDFMGPARVDSIKITTKRKKARN